MISVIIPVLNAQQTLAATLGALVPAVVDGIVREVVVVDAQSTDDTRNIADAMGARLLDAPRGRGSQLQVGAAEARHDWLLFLHADTILEPDWHCEVARLIESIELGERPPAAAVFRWPRKPTSNVVC